MLVSGCQVQWDQGAPLGAAPGWELDQPPTLSSGEPGRQEAQPRGRVSLSGSLSLRLCLFVSLLVPVSVSAHTESVPAFANLLPASHPGQPVGCPEVAAAAEWAPCS